MPEITPRCAAGAIRFNGDGEQVDDFADAATHVRALVEGQFVLRRLHAQELGVVVRSGYVTGKGAASMLHYVH